VTEATDVPHGCIADGSKIVIVLHAAFLLGYDEYFCVVIDDGVEDSALHLMAPFNAEEKGKRAETLLPFYDD
jgi:hypothetical protein